MQLLPTTSCISKNYKKSVFDIQAYNLYHCAHFPRIQRFRVRLDGALEWHRLIWLLQSAGWAQDKVLDSHRDLLRKVFGNLVIQLQLPSQ